jgi:hypothetical protein
MATATTAKPRARLIRFDGTSDRIGSPGRCGQRVASAIDRVKR